MNSLSQGLNFRDYTATGLNTEDELYKALFSDDQGQGAAAIELDKAVQFINYYTRTDDVRNHRDYTLEMIIEEFTGFKRRLFERDSIYLRRFLAVTERKKDEVWGTKWNIKHVFEMYFSALKVFVAENTSDTNLLENGDFEDQENTAWILDGGAAINYSARFSGSRGLYFNRVAGFAAQTIELAQGVYALHFFLEGTADVVLTNGAGQYWDAKHLKWSDDPFVNQFRNNVWDNCEILIQIPPEDGDVLHITFTGSKENVICIDYVRLFQKLRYPAYTVIIQYDGYAIDDKTLHLGKGVTDPDPAITWYQRESYFDNSYIVGRIGAYRLEVYQALLDIIRPRGIRAFIETVEKITED